MLENENVMTVSANVSVACAVAKLKVGSLMKVPKVERTYLVEACTKPPLRNCHVLALRCENKTYALFLSDQLAVSLRVAVQ